MATNELRSPVHSLRRRPAGREAAPFVLLMLLAAFTHSPAQVVELTLLAGAEAKGAVCLDGSPPGYHLQRGFGSGTQSWMVDLQGGGWCNTTESCSERKMTEFGSSKFMKAVQYDGILSNEHRQNSDFYNWNIAVIRYCDGASFAGDGEGQDQDGDKLYFRGLRIWQAVVDELMEKGMASAKQALLTGCSAGGLAALLHCDNFRARFPHEVSVKCLPDAGFFVDIEDISGERSMRSLLNGVVHLQNVREVLPKDCLAKKDRTKCFFADELIKTISTPTLILNSDYDSRQIREFLAPNGSYPAQSWSSCKADIRNCSSTQIEVLHGWLCVSIRSISTLIWSLSCFLQPKNFTTFFLHHVVGLRKTLVSKLKVVEDKWDWGLFIDSCFTHCQLPFKISWNSPISPRLGNKTIEEAVGDWFFERSQVKEIDCEYPCNPTCSSQLPT